MIYAKCQNPDCSCKSFALPISGIERYQRATQPLISEAVAGVVQDNSTLRRIAHRLRNAAGITFPSIPQATPNPFPLILPTPWKKRPNTLFSIETTPAHFLPPLSPPGQLIAILMAEFQKFQLMTISTYDLTSSSYTDIEEVVRRDL